MKRPSKQTMEVGRAVIATAVMVMLAGLFAVHPIIGVSAVCLLYSWTAKDEPRTYRRRRYRAHPRSH
jgi:hypothetical protein